MWTALVRLIRVPPQEGPHSAENVHVCFCLSYHVYSSFVVCTPVVHTAYTQGGSSLTRGRGHSCPRPCVATSTTAVFVYRSHYCFFLSRINFSNRRKTFSFPTTLVETEHAVFAVHKYCSATKVHVTHSAQTPGDAHHVVGHLRKYCCSKN